MKDWNSSIEMRTQLSLLSVTIFDLSALNQVGTGSINYYYYGIRFMPLQ